MKRIGAVLVSVPLLVAARTNAQDLEPEQVRQALEFLAAGFGELKPSGRIVLEVPDDEPSPVGVTAAGIKSGLASYQSSFTFSETAGGKDVRVESDPALVPGRRFVSGQVRWSDAERTGKGNEADELVPLEDLADSRLLLPSARQRPKSLTGQLTVRYPGRIAVAELGAGELNKDKPLAKASCRLVSLDNDLATASCAGEIDSVQLLPLSAKGVVLDTRASTVGPTLVHRELQKSRKLPPAAIERLVAQRNDLGKAGRTWVMNAKGKVAKVLALCPVDYRTETLPIQAFPPPDFTGKTCPAIPAPHFAQPAPSDNYVPMSAAEIKHGTRILASRSEAMIGFNNQVILFQLPQVPNSWLAELQVKDLVLKKRRATVAFEPQGPFLDEKAGFVHSFRMEPKSGEEPVAYDTASGKLLLHYAARVVTRKVTAPGKTGDVTVQACEVRWYGDGANLDLTSRRPPLRAYDKKGRSLRMIENYSVGGMNEAGAFSGKRFWGEIAWVEVDEVKQWQDIAIPFSLRPAPPLPKETAP
ncbi:MAG: hypothetical protein JXP73_15895 [Deltaproteobacteria bacterium]|nr:hypothetical protein [Deltaproteobacteria bacterium]